MKQLHELIAADVRAWRTAGYPTAGFGAIAEILSWARETESGSPRFLRRAQFVALETYWFLRLKKTTPHVFDLYTEYYPKHSELLKALGLENSEIKAFVMDEGLKALWTRLKKDDDFVRAFKLESLRETLTLSYPSYILALAMGAGKTVLIGAIIATEFAMAMEYPEGPFVQNALVFAPGKTIIEALRELLETPYQQIIPPRLHKAFGASAKFVFTRDGEKGIPVIRGSSFNVVVTNTEKIRIQKESVRKGDLGPLFSPEREEEARSEVANLRLQTIASLPHLAVFSDEAHHTYGQSLDEELKKVRKTVDYLAASTNVIAVVNTTGTPYFQRQPLKDVVVWYGLSEGVRDGILKDVSGHIQAFDFDGDAGKYVEHVLEDFFKSYRDVCLPNGSPAKIALYFPQTDDLKDLKPRIDQTLVKLGLSPALALINTSDETLTKTADINAFNKLNDPTAPHRVILLVNKGTEGWNCPSLFACALVRKLKSSNNFVLQASTRCLRQVPGNSMPARIFLSSENFDILDRQLQETYGESIAELNRTGQETGRARIVLRKLSIPPLVVTQTIRKVTRGPDKGVSLKLQKPNRTDETLRKTSFVVAEQEATYSVLQQLGDTVEIKVPAEGFDVYGVSVELGARFRIDHWTLLDELRRLYGKDDIPQSHIEGLAAQVEEQTRSYKVVEEKVDVALALVKPAGFEKEIDSAGIETYTAEIIYPKGREHLLLPVETLAEHNKKNIGFHYTPYNFDSNPEKSFFEQVLLQLDLEPSEIEDMFFTGALTDPEKTDFFVEYKDEKGKWRKYTPDFVIRKKPSKGARPGTGKVLIVEIKREHDRSHEIDGENGRKAVAVRRWEDLNPKRLKYQMIFTQTDVVTADQVREAVRIAESEE